MSQTFPPVRLAALDLDGTLLNHEGQVTPRTRAALQAASDRGVVIVPTTGRPLGNLPPVVAQLPGVRYAITSNGAAVWDLGSDPLGAVYSRYANAAERQTSEPTCLLRRLMPVETARAAFDLFMEYPGGMGVFWNGYSVKDQASVDFASARWARLHSTEARQPNDGRFLVVRDLGEWMSRHAHEVEKQCLFFAEQDQVPQALARFRAMPGVEVVQGPAATPSWTRSHRCSASRTRLPMLRAGQPSRRSRCLNAIRTISSPSPCTTAKAPRRSRRSNPALAGKT